MSVSEEEVDEESGCGRDMAAAVSSDHAIYAPKPTYDQLDQYSSLSKRNEKEKQRRSGLATIAPKAGGGSSDSEEEEEIETKKLLILCSSPLRNRHLLNRHPRCHSDPEVAPLSPPPSLDKEEEEEELVAKEIEEEDDNDKRITEEGEPELPSTPESSPSNASTSPVFPPGDAGETEDGKTKLLPQVNVIPTTTSAPSTPTAAAFDSSIPRSASAPWAPSEQSLLEPDRPRSASWTASPTVFPSLQDAHLRALGVSVQDSVPNENLSAPEIENKFKQISLAFKTDRITLKQRLEVQQRQRDIAEANFDRELKLLESSILALHEDCIDMELVDAIMQLRKHLDVLTISSASLLSASEVWGAVQQEWRVSRALEVLLLHVENVKRLYENDHQELEEMRRILNEHQIEYPATTGTGSSGQTTTTDSALGSIRIRALSLAGVSKQSQESGNRRISLGPNASKNLRDFLGGRGSKRRASLMPDLGLFHQEIAAAAVAAAASNASSNSYLSKEKLEEKRHSTNGMLGNSITEEGSESGDETSGNTRPATGDSSPTATSGTKITNFPLDLYTQGMQDSDQRANEEFSSSSFHAPTSDSHSSSNFASNLIPQAQHWAVHGFEDFIGWVRGGRWPFSSQQTYQGVRYLFTSFLLILAVLFLLLTISSGNEVQQPCHPGWTTIHHLLHPYVTIRHTGPAEF